MVHVDVSLGGPQQLIEMLSCPMCMNVNALWAGGTLLDKPYHWCMNECKWVNDELLC